MAEPFSPFFFPSFDDVVIPQPQARNLWDDRGELFCEKTHIVRIITIILLLLHGFGFYPQTSCKTADLLNFHDVLQVKFI